MKKLSNGQKWNNVSQGFFNTWSVFFQKCAKLQAEKQKHKMCKKRILEGVGKVTQAHVVLVIVALSITLIYTSWDLCTYPASYNSEQNHRKDVRNKRTIKSFLVNK